MKRIAVIANCGKARAGDVLRRLLACADSVGIELVCDKPSAALLGEESRGLALPELFEDVDAVMALGGDGTMLRTVRELDGRETPVIGFNIGSLGFMTSVAENAFDSAMACLANDDFILSQRTLAQCQLLPESGQPESYRALNDVVLNRGQSSRVLVLRVTIDGETVTSYMCDGLVIATPTGSTGHSLAAGGPILSPTTPAFVITPLCPHALSSRPLVIPDASHIRLEAVNGVADMQLAIDGQVNLGLKPGDAVEVAKSDCSVGFIHFPDYSYYSVLRQKLNWRGSSI